MPSPSSEAGVSSSPLPHLQKRGIPREKTAEATTPIPRKTAIPSPSTGEARARGRGQHAIPERETLSSAGTSGAATHHAAPSESPLPEPEIHGMTSTVSSPESRGRNLRERALRTSFSERKGKEKGCTERVRKGYRTRSPREGNLFPEPLSAKGLPTLSRRRKPSRVLRKNEEICRLIIYGSSHRTVSAAEPFRSSITSRGVF